MKKLCILMALVMCLSALFVSASAEEFIGLPDSVEAQESVETQDPVEFKDSVKSWTIDVDALKAIEAADTFPVKVTGKTISDGAAGTALTYSGTDTMSLTLTNNYNQAVSDVVIAAVAYDADNHTTTLNTSTINMSTTKALDFCTLEQAIPAGGTGVINLRVDHSTFVNARVLVYSFTAEDGTKYVNSSFARWSTLAMGGKAYAACNASMEQLMAAQEADGAMVTGQYIVNNISMMTYGANAEARLLVANCGDEVIDSMTIMVLGFDQNMLYYEVSGDELRVVGSGTKNVPSFTVSDMGLTPGAETYVATKIKADNIAYIASVVVSYTTVSGKVVDCSGVDAMENFVLTGGNAVSLD